MQIRKQEAYDAAMVTHPMILVFSQSPEEFKRFKNGFNGEMIWVRETHQVRGLDYRLPVYCLSSWHQTPAKQRWALTREAFAYAGARFNVIVKLDEHFEMVR